MTPYDRRQRFAVEPVIVDGRLEAELRAVRWLGAHARLLTWLRLTRQLPALPEGTSVIELRRRGGTVDFRLTVPAVTWRLDLREAASRGRPVVP